MGSPFASMIVSDPIPLPFDEGQWVKVRKLTGRQHEAAQIAHRSGFVAGSSNAWALTFRRALEKGASDPDVLKAISDPLTGYDRYELARAGLVAWSYDLPLARMAAVAATDKTPAQPAVDAIEDLSDEAIDFIAREVLRLTKPGLFVATVEEAEAEKKSA